MIECEGTYDGGHGIDIWCGADGEWYVGERDEPFRNLTTSGKWESVRGLKSGMPEDARHMQFPSVGAATLALIRHGYPDGTKMQFSRSPVKCPAVYGTEDVTLTGYVDWKGRRMEHFGKCDRNYSEAFVEVAGRTPEAARWVPAADVAVDGAPLVGALLGLFSWKAV